MKAFRLLIPLCGLILAGLLSSCHHKDLRVMSRSELIVVYDWRNAPDADPESMELRLHPDEAPEEVVNFFFQNKTGGPLNAPIGDYTAVTLNADLINWAQTRNHNDPDAFELFTNDTQILENAKVSARSIPRAEGAEDERMANTPGMVWADRRDNIGIHQHEGVQTITFYPEELVCHYIVDVYNVKNLESLRSTLLDGTLSGMAEGVHPGRKTATDNSVTMPFTLTVQPDGTSLHGEFLTFGETPSTSRRHTMNIYMTLTDGSRWYATADVTDQVSNAPDPRHVHIILRDIEFPKTISGSGGIVPDVEDWQAVYIDMRM